MSIIPTRFPLLKGFHVIQCYPRRGRTRPQPEKYHGRDSARQVRGHHRLSGSANRHWPSIPSSPRDSAATWNPCPHTRASYRPDGQADVDYIDGLSPAVSIDQKSTSHNPRSTVGTVTEIYDYLRLLYARGRHPALSVCGREWSSSPRRRSWTRSKRFQMGPASCSWARSCAPQGTYQAVFEEIRKAGFGPCSRGRNRPFAR